MTDKARELVDDLKGRYEGFMDLLTSFMEYEDDLRGYVVQAHEAKDRESLADIGYILRQWQKGADELKKAIGAKLDLNTKAAAHLVAKEFEDDQTSSANCRGRYGLAMPDIKPGLRIPGKDTPEYRLLCKWAGVNDEVINEKVISFSYPRLTEIASKFMAEGKPLPPGFLNQYDKTVCTYRKVSKKR